MSGVEIVQEVVTILVSGLKEMATGIGEGVSELAKALFFTTTGTGAEATSELSIFGTLIIVFAGIALAESEKPLASINCYKNLECFNTNQNGSDYFKRFSHVQRIGFEPFIRI